MNVQLVSLNAKVTDKFLYQIIQKYLLIYLSKIKHVQGTPTILDRGLDNSKNHLGACQMILIIFFPQKVYILINKSQRIHILKPDLKKSCPGDDGTIPERMSLQPGYSSAKVLDKRNRCKLGQIALAGM